MHIAQALNNALKVLVTSLAFGACLSVDGFSAPIPPIFIGPILLHGKATYDVYHFFLSKLAASLGSNNQPQLIIGSDEETALRKAIKNVFPDSSNILCSRHLKNFFENFLQNKIGLNKVFRTKFLKMIFGNTGLIHSKSVSEFEDNVKMILNKIPLLIPNSTKLENYLCGPRGFITSIRTGVIEPSIRHKLPPNWTNNNAESINHVIKSAINWKILTLPNLVDKLQRITDVASVGVTPRIFPTFTITQKQEELESSVLQ